MRTGVEIVEIKKASGKSLERRYQDIGAFSLIAIVVTSTRRSPG
jgi:hypothetical protein